MPSLMRAKLASRPLCCIAKRIAPFRSITGNGWRGRSLVLGCSFFPAMRMHHGLDRWTLHFRPIHFCEDNRPGNLNRTGVKPCSTASAHFPSRPFATGSDTLAAAKTCKANVLLKISRDGSGASQYLIRITKAGRLPRPAQILTSARFAGQVHSLDRARRCLHTQVARWVGF